MENYQGDLTDIVRGSSTATYGCKIEDPFAFASAEWQFHPSMNNLDQLEQPRSQEDQYSFGDPFCAAAMRDPLLHELDMCGSSSSPSAASSSTTCTLFNGGHDQDDHLIIKTPPSSNTNIFSRMLQISPSTNKFPISSPHSSPLLPNSTSPIPLINANSSEFHHFLDNAGAVQISSPRNPAGIKRRKSQARKVVCVPAPVAASSRPNGEVIPSDLWAWRKYGQKPIKGSPYPRGYYRCSSSKGCSARKQVERSRTDPNMLVITYTSEHNHPWPTQRNALAGSSRSQQSKNSAPNSKLQPQKPTPEADTNNDNKTQIFGAPNVKEEAIDHQEIIEKQFEAEDNGDFSEGFQYRLAMPPNNNQSDDFFADLEELETDPLNLLFSTGGDDGRQKEGKGGLDDVAFSLFDWAAENNNNNNNANSTSFEEAAAGKRGFY